jgi:hypothetical protein
MKYILLASVAFLFVGTSASFAAMPALDMDPAFSTVIPHDFLQLAKDGGDDNGGGNSSNDDDGDDDGDDNGGDRDRSSNDDSNDDSPQSNSNRRKPRVPGGSGCDSAQDIAEHAECRAQ